MSKQLVRSVLLPVNCGSVFLNTTTSAADNPADGFLYGDPRPDAPALAYCEGVVKDWIVFPGKA